MRRWDGNAASEREKPTTYMAEGRHSLRPGRRTPAALGSPRRAVVAGGMRARGRGEVLLAVIGLATIAAAQKPHPPAGNQRCSPTLVDDQAAALEVLQSLAQLDPDGEFWWLGQYRSAQPELNPTMWPGAVGIGGLAFSDWAADAVPPLASTDDPCGFIASKLLCEALPRDPITFTTTISQTTFSIGSTLCPCSCSAVQPDDGFGGLAVRHGCPATGSDEPPLPVTWTTFACPQMSWSGLQGNYLVPDGVSVLPGSGANLPIALLGGTLAECAESCAGNVACDGVSFGYDQESQATFCALKAVQEQFMPEPRPELVQLDDAVHAVWELRWAVGGTGAAAPVDQGFVDALSQASNGLEVGSEALFEAYGQNIGACYQERMCWTTLCLQQEAVAVRAFGSISMENTSDVDCATAVAAPEGYRVDWRLDRMSRSAHANAGRLELYNTLSPLATPARVIKGGMSCSETGTTACSVTGRSTGPVLYIKERESATAGEASWKISWQFVPESEPGCTACVPGCVLSNATNFDPAATVDDRSCSFEGLGCGDPAATNYDPALSLDAPFPGECEYSCDTLVSQYIPDAAERESHCFDSGPGRVDQWKTRVQGSKRMGVTPSSGKSAQPCLVPSDATELCASATSVDVLLLGDADWLDEGDSSLGDDVDIKGSFIIHGSAQSPRIAVQIVASGPMTVLRWITFTARPYSQYGDDRSPMALALMNSPVRMQAVITRCSFVGLSTSAQGGAILAGSNSVVRIDHSSFVRCHALSGGALVREGEAAHLQVHNTLFEMNYAETSLVSRRDGYSGTGGAIVAGASTIVNSAQTLFSLESCTFRSNGVILDNVVDFLTVRGGWTIHLDYLDPSTWWIRDSHFAAGNHNPIFSVFLTASGTLSCTQHPCPVGYECSVRESSLHCDPCSASQFSDDGILCAQCPAGKEASVAASACEQCPAGLYSDGVRALRCSHCPEGQRANNHSTACEVPECHEGSYSSEHGQCVCPSDAYNSSQGTVECIDTDDIHIEPPLLPARLHCQPCPPCLTCTRSGQIPMITKGWALATRSTAPKWTVDGPSGRLRLYSCPHDEDNAAGDPYTCKPHLANISSNDCFEGFDGALCGTCAVGYTRKNRDCVSCPAAKEALQDRYIRIIIPVVVLCLLAIFCTLGKKAKSLIQFMAANNVRDIINCLSSSMHIVISMVQITSQFSAVLDFSFKDHTPTADEIHKTLGHMLLDLKVLVELGCWGLTEEDTFYWKWVADVVIIPGFLCGLLFIVYACGCGSRVVSTSRARSRSTSSGGSSDLARMRSDLSEGLQSELEVVHRRTTGAVGWIYAGIFFTLPRMTTTAFNAFKCRDLGDPDEAAGGAAAGACEKWLEAAYAVDCCSARYDLLVLGGVVGAAAILAFPLGFAVVLTQETRKNWRKFERAQAEASYDAAHRSMHEQPFSVDGTAAASDEGRSSLRRESSPATNKFPVGSRGATESDEADGYRLNLTLDFFDELWLFADKSQFYEYNYRQLDEHFNFFVYSFRPGAYYWEIVEVLYKIFMSGFLMFAPGGRGSVGQLFCGLLISFLMVALQVRVWPYNNDPDNWLRFGAEIQIFQTIAVALVLKTHGSTHTALDALDKSSIDSGYDWLLVFSFWVLTPLMLVLVICAKLAAKRRAQKEEDAIFQDAWRASGQSGGGLDFGIPSPTPTVSDAGGGGGGGGGSGGGRGEPARESATAFEMRSLR